MEDRKEISIELKSEPMNEMLSHPPSWITRSGNGLILLIILIVFGLTWIIEYPDEINGEVIVSTTEPPIELSNQLYVQLKSINVADGEFVNKGQLILEFDNNAKTTDIQKAQFFIDRLSKIAIKNGQKIPYNKMELQLGSFNKQWIELELKLKEWNDLQDGNLLTLKVNSINQEIIYRQQLQTISNKRIDLSERDFALISEELKSSERLAKEHAISTQSLNQDRKNESQANQTLQSQKEVFVQNMIQLNSLKNELAVLKYDLKLQEEKAKSDLQLAIFSIQNSLLDWEKSSIWLSPCNGKVLFNKQLQVNKYYSANQASIVIVPKGNSFNAIAIINSEGAGKVRKGQMANIELLDFPKSEFGMLEGIIENLTQIDKEGKYEVKIKLTKQLETSFKKQLPGKAQMKGSVKIITKKKRLIERFFEKITDLLK